MPWPPAVEWDEAAVRAWIARGELVIRTSHRLRQWWLPVSRTNGDNIVRSLTYVLGGWWKTYRDVDETGRLDLVLWRAPDGALGFQPTAGAEVIAARLAPGCRVNGQGGGGISLVYRLGEDFGLRLQDAAALGWVEVGPGREPFSQEGSKVDSSRN